MRSAGAMRCATFSFWGSLYVLCLPAVAVAQEGATCLLAGP